MRLNWEGGKDGTAEAGLFCLLVGQGVAQDGTWMASVETECGGEIDRTILRNATMDDAKEAAESLLAGICNDALEALSK